jgi:hypothetical protein
VTREGSLPITHSICPECSDTLMGRGAAPIPPLSPRAVAGGYEVADPNGFRVVCDLHSINAATAIATILNQYLKGDGLCLVHLMETVNGRCLSCSVGTGRSPFAVPR